MNSSLIDEQAFGKATHLERFRLATKVLMGLSGINRLNQLYANHAQEEGLDFIAGVFKELELKLDFNQTELERIPKTGGFITVSNHPFGALDGLILIYLLSQKRSDFKVMANFLLREVKPLEAFFLAINPFEKRSELGSSFSGTKAAIQHLKADSPLGIFPAGEVSSFQTEQRQIVDRPWNKTVLKLIQKAEVPIIPIHFKGSNSLLFHLLGIIHPSLRTLALPAELIKKKSTTVKVRIGKPIKVADQKEWPSAEQLGRFLRAKTYSLGTSAEVIPFYKGKVKRLSRTKPIAAQPQQELMIAELQKVQANKILEQAEFEVYCCNAYQIPHLIKEIGRQREITFREVGEGTNKAVDLDQYDLYYQQLFLWDKKAKKLAGAYRIGNGNEIMRTHGKKGFYLHSLFKFKKGFTPILEKCLEMGRSFVVKDYQQKRLPLFLLWKGIMHYILTNPEITYLTGPVSISNAYSKFSRMIMVEFIRRYYYDESLAKQIEPRKRFKVKFKEGEGDPLLESAKADLKKVEQLIVDIEPNHARLPVLIKKYIKQNAKIIGFNLDPKFNRALDGLMILDLAELPDSSIQDLKQDMKLKV